MAIEKKKQLNAARGSLGFIDPPESGRILVRRRRKVLKDPSLAVDLPSGNDMTKRSATAGAGAPIRRRTI